MEKQHPIPKVGDTVRLNQHGINRIAGSDALAYLMTLTMKVVWVSDRPMKNDNHDVYQIRVDRDELGCFLIDHRCVDIVKD